MADVYALIGSPIDRSPSPAMHNAAFVALGLAARYELRPAGAGDIPAVMAELRQGRWQGLNVTTPLKQLMAAEVQLDGVARRARAVNTLWRDNLGWHGALTDVQGIAAPLSERGLGGPATASRAADAGREALVLGAGGAARAAVLALEELGCVVHVAARRAGAAAAVLAELAPRRPGQALALADRAALSELFARLGVIVQATPVGRLGDRHDLPWPLTTPGTLAFELVYLPRRTPFLDDAERHGGAILEGWQMLVEQGAAAFSWWTGQPAPRQVMRQAVLDELTRRP